MSHGNYQRDGDQGYALKRLMLLYAEQKKTAGTERQSCCQHPACPLHLIRYKGYREYSQWQITGQGVLRRFGTVSAHAKTIGTDVQAGEHQRKTSARYGTPLLQYVCYRIE